jgi:excisionase family DNA binding protein
LRAQRGAGRIREGECLMEHEEWLTINQAAELSGYHPDHIRRIVRKGEIEARKFGPVWAVNHESLISYVHRMELLGEKRGPKSEI